MLDDIDRHIVELLRANGRASVSDIARTVGLSAAPVSRRIERLEHDGVIRGYTALVDDRLAGRLEAFTEIRLAGAADSQELAEIVRHIPEVEAFYTIAGDPDALVRLRTDDVDHLQRVVNQMRRSGKVAGTKTLIVMHSWTRTDGSPEQDGRRSR